jgi:alpha-1,6-mannosyltransferase
VKILDISSFYSDNGGGVRTYHQQKLKYFQAHREHQYVMLVSGSTNSMEVADGGTVYRLKGFPITKNADYRQICDYFALKRILETEKPDVIEIGSIYLDNWLALIGTFKTEVVKVALYHADFPDSYLAPAVEGFPQIFKKKFVSFWHWYVQFACSRMDATCVTSRYIQQKLDSMGVRNTLHVPLGVDTATFHPRYRSHAIRTALNIAEGATLLLYVGRFSTEKGIETMMDALPAITAQPGTAVVLVGGGPIQELVHHKAAGNDSIKVLPFVRDQEYLRALYASADIFLSPGPYETFGLATLEALSSGLPVVVADKGGAAELVRRCKGGVFFEANNPKSMSDTVIDMLSDDLGTFAQNARTSVESLYSWENTFDTLMSSYGRLVHARKEMRFKTAS